MILTLIVAIPCAWLGRKIERKRQESEAVLAIVKLGGEAVYDYNLDGTERPGQTGCESYWARISSPKSLWRISA